MSVTDDFATLAHDLRRHAALYTEGKPEITDADYDAMFKKLQALEAQFTSCKDPNSPTARVGSPSLSDFPKVKHARKMLSLDNAMTAQEVVDKLGYTGWVTWEPKIDGLSLSLTYEGRKLVKAVTRGDGTTGDDVTINARTIKTIPLILSEKAPATRIEVRGEAFMRFSVFEELNSALEDDDKFANPRNAAAGTMKLKDSRAVAARKLDFMAYELIGEEDIAMYSDLLHRLNDEQFMTPLHAPRVDDAPISTVALGAGGSFTDSALAIKGMEDIHESLDFPIDGMVIKVSDMADRADLGDGTRAPKWAIAFKFPPERKSTLLKDVEVSVGRHGTLTPIAILEQVHLSGTKVHRASMFNEAEIARLGVAVGDTVMVEKSAEIIPRVCSVYERCYTDPKTGKTGTIDQLLAERKAQGIENE